MQIAALGEVFYYLYSCRSLKINDKTMAELSAGLNSRDLQQTHPNDFKLGRVDGGAVRRQMLISIISRFQLASRK